MYSVLRVCAWHVGCVVCVCGVACMRGVVKSAWCADVRVVCVRVWRVLDSKLPSQSIAVQRRRPVLRNMERRKGTGGVLFNIIRPLGPPPGCESSCVRWRDPCTHELLLITWATVVLARPNLPGLLIGGCGPAPKGPAFPSVFDNSRKEVVSFCSGPHSGS